MEELVLFVMMFVFVYLGYLIFVINKPKVLNNMVEGRELMYLKKIYKLDYEKINIKKIARAVALTNSFILSFVTSIVFLINDWIDNFYLQLLLMLVMGFIILIPLILILYNMIGKHYAKIQKGVK